MKHAFAMLFGGLFGRLWQTEAEQAIFMIGLLRGLMIGVIAAKLINTFA